MSISDKIDHVTEALERVSRLFPESLATLLGLLVALLIALDVLRALGGSPEPPQTSRIPETQTIPAPAPKNDPLCVVLPSGDQICQ